MEITMKRTRLFAILFLFSLETAWCTFALDHARAQTTPVSFHPDAPPEIKQFDFLNGEFTCTYKGLVDQVGNYQTSTGHTWKGYFTLGGFAFQDDWYSNGSNYRGTTWRTYDTANKRWICKWLQAGTDNPAGFTDGYFMGN